LRQNEHKLFFGVDKIAILTYALLVFMGWLNIYAAVYNEEHQNIFDTSQKYGMQLIWIGSAFFIATFILIIDAGFYTVFAYFFYVFLLVACIAVPYVGRSIKGSRSWFGFGSFGVQPAEFMKFATNLALAKYLSNVNIEVETSSRKSRLSDLIKNYKNTIIAVIILGLPLLIIKVLQDETGLALVLMAFIITLYREGLSVNFLIFGLLSALLFILSLVMESQTLIISLGVIAALSFLFVKRSRKNLIIISIVFAAASGVVLGTNFVYQKLEPHQKDRIDVLLGKKTDLKGVGYNVNQAKIAIGSGGFWGKGYLQGTQTKYDFVPEQDTDFIFCTVGEEWGFVGTSVVIILELFLIIRVIFMAERQRSPFSRIYGYGVASVLFFHLAVNVGMTIGLMPVIGIPLPFFSYGGSSLWSFTILLFIFIKLDANRLVILR
jgi:rod shape determining protein RodA